MANSGDCQPDSDDLALEFMERPLWHEVCIEAVAFVSRLPTLQGVLDCLLRRLKIGPGADWFSCLAVDRPWCHRSKVGSKRGWLETMNLTNLAPSRQVKRFRIRNSELYRKESDRESTFQATFQHIIMLIFRDVKRLSGLESLRLTHDFSIRDLPELRHRWLEEPAKGRSVEVPREEPLPTNWNSLSLDLQDNILNRVDFKDLCRCKALSVEYKELIESDGFCQLRGSTSEGYFTAISYYIRNSAWQCSGYDMESNSWRSLPTFSYLPTPQAYLFKEFSVSGHRSLMCAHVSKPELVVFNPLTGRKRVLPPLLNPRAPVLVHILEEENSYTVVVAGSSSANEEHLSKKVEVFRSTTSQWTEVGDVPGPVFGLNEHQAGVCINGILYFIAFLEGTSHRGVVAFDVKNGTWVENLTCLIPFSPHSNTLQLVECNGKLHLFSEQERRASVEHCIDVLDSGSHSWRTVVRVKRSGGRGLQVYPEHTCVSFGEGKLCVVNTLSRDGAVYDMRDGKQVAALPPPLASQKGERFFTLNPASFTLQPRFDTNPVTIAANS